MRTLRVQISVFALALSMSRVGHADPPPTGASAQFAVINLLRGIPAVGVVGQVTARPGTVLVPSLAAGASTNVTLAPGTWTFSVRAPNAPFTAPRLGEPAGMTVVAGQHQMLFLYGTGALASVLNIDVAHSPAPPAGRGLLRFGNLIVASVTLSDSENGAVDLCVAGATLSVAATPLFVGTPYGASAGAPGTGPDPLVTRAPVPLGTPQTWQVRRSASRPCAGTLLASGPVTLPPATPTVVAIAQGRWQGPDPITVDLCPESGAACRTVTLARPASVRPRPRR
jgi:hypothetical protein